MNIWLLIIIFFVLGQNGNGSCGCSGRDESDCGCQNNPCPMPIPREECGCGFCGDNRMPFIPTPGPCGCDKK